MNKFQKIRNRSGVALVTMGASAAALADDPFTAAVTDASTKVGTYGAALVGVAAAGVAFAIAIKYVKKISRAA